MGRGRAAEEDSRLDDKFAEALAQIPVTTSAPLGSLPPQTNLRSTASSEAGYCLDDWQKPWREGDIKLSPPPRRV
jgi:hypothetical protein